jgi:hypothetical protein
MAAPAFVKTILGLRNGVPNNADIDSETSRAIAGELMRILGVVRVAIPGEAPGTVLELAVRDHLRLELPSLVPNRIWEIERRYLITHFTQYDHLARLDARILADPTLRVEIGRDYLVKPDVTVGIVQSGHLSPFLHAAVSCKWTIRSDRVQNIRHEGVILSRHRRGRQPHIVTVTAEPLPSRLAAIARGTGEVDAVYHVALDELVAATNLKGTQDQKDVLDELITQDRLLDFSRLPETLTL